MISTLANSRKACLALAADLIAGRLSVIQPPGPTYEKGQYSVSGSVGSVEALPLPARPTHSALTDAETGRRSKAEFRRAKEDYHEFGECQAQFWGLSADIPVTHEDPALVSALVNFMEDPGEGTLAALTDLVAERYAQKGGGEPLDQDYILRLGFRTADSDLGHYSLKTQGREWVDLRACAVWEDGEVNHRLGFEWGVRNVLRYTQSADREGNDQSNRASGVFRAQGRLENRADLLRLLTAYGVTPSNELFKSTVAKE